MKYAQVVATGPGGVESLSGWLPYDEAVQKFKGLNQGPRPADLPEGFDGLAVTLLDGGRTSKGRFRGEAAAEAKAEAKAPKGKSKKKAGG